MHVPESIVLLRFITVFLLVSTSLTFCFFQNGDTSDLHEVEERLSDVKQNGFATTPDEERDRPCPASPLLGSTKLLMVDTEMEEQSGAVG